MTVVRLHHLHGAGAAPWIGGGFEDTINEFLTYREALMFRLRLTLLAGRPDLPVHMERLASPGGVQVQVENGELTNSASSLRIPLLMSDVVYEVVPSHLRSLGNYVLAIAPRGPLRAGEGVESDLKQVWFLCFLGTEKALEAFLSQVSCAGALRWDIMEVMSQNWRRLHTGRSTVASCWPRMMVGSTSAASKRHALPACVAVKTVDCEAAKMEREMRLLSRCHHHPNINSFMGVFCLEEPSKMPPTTKGRCWAMVTQLESGNDLQSRVESRKFLEEPTVVKAMLGVAGAVAFLHKLKIIHREVKASHVLLSYEGNGILTDFSSAVDLSESQNQWPAVVSHDNTAPELATGNYDGMVDVYGMGVVIYYALCGKLPYCSGTDQKLKKGKVNYSIAALDRASNSLRLLLRAALAVEPHNRPTARAAFVALWHLVTEEQRSFSTRTALMLKDD